MIFSDTNTHTYTFPGADGTIALTSNLTSLNSFSASNANTSLNTYTSSLNNAIQLTGSTVSFLGNIVVYGTQSVINSTNVEISDNMIYLNANSTYSNPDLGFAGNYNDGTYHHAGFFRDHATGLWKVFDSYLPEPDASPYIDTSNSSFRIASFQANTINLTANPGTAPLTVTSTTRVANLNVATSGVANTVNDAAQPNITSVGTLTSVSVSGNANVGNLGTATAIITTGNITTINSGLLQNGNSNVTITANGNVTINAVGGARIVATSTGANITGTLSASGNANVGNIGATGVFSTTVSATGNANVGNIGTTGVFSTTLSATGNANVGNIGIGGIVSASGNASVLGIKTDNYYYANGVSISFAGTYSNSNVASYLPTFTGQVGTTGATFYGNTLTTGANTTAGTVTGNWSLSPGSRLNATYADLAEYYEADQPYDPGTVLEFGGDKEVTLATDETNRVAGVVSTDPAYVMNTGCPGHAVPIALQGRVPVKVRGNIKKGDMMISGGDGYARPCNTPIIGSVIGKAVANFDGPEGIVEIAVGRL